MAEPGRGARANDRRAAASHRRRHRRRARRRRRPYAQEPRRCWPVPDYHCSVRAGASRSGSAAVAVQRVDSTSLWQHRFLSAPTARQTTFFDMIKAPMRPRAISFDGQTRDHEASRSAPHKPHQVTARASAFPEHPLVRDYVPRSKRPRRKHSPIRRPRWDAFLRTPSQRWREEPRVARSRAAQFFGSTNGHTLGSNLPYCDHRRLGSPDLAKTRRLLLDSDRRHDTPIPRPARLHPPPPSDLGLTVFLIEHDSACHGISDRVPCSPMRGPRRRQPGRGSPNPLGHRGVPGRARPGSLTLPSLGSMTSTPTTADPPARHHLTVEEASRLLSAQRRRQVSDPSPIRPSPTAPLRDPLCSSPDARAQAHEIVSLVVFRFRGPPFVRADALRITLECSFRVRIERTAAESHALELFPRLASGSAEAGSYRRCEQILAIGRSLMAPPRSSARRAVDGPAPIRWSRSSRSSRSPTGGRQCCSWSKCAGVIGHRTTGYSCTARSS